MCIWDSVWKAEQLLLMESLEKPDNVKVKNYNEGEK